MKAPASATASSAMSSARACCCISSTRTEDDVAEAYRIVRGELEAYGAGLDDKPEIVALSKIDALDADGRRRRKLKALAKALAGATPLRAVRR